MRVWRVENADGGGPYNGSYVPGISGGSRETHPGPCNDGIKSLTKEHVCGFTTLRQFKQWFNAEDRRLLYARGFELVQYNARKCLIGGRQVAFVKGRMLQRKSLATFSAAALDTG